MTAGQTTLATMVSLEVIADMVSAKPKLIKFTPLAYVETALKANGVTSTVPAWECRRYDKKLKPSYFSDQLTTKRLLKPSKGC